MISAEMLRPGKFVLSRQWCWKRFTGQWHWNNSWWCCYSRFSQQRADFWQVCCCHMPVIFMIRRKC